MLFTVGKIQKQLKEVKASIHRERLDISRFKYIESDCPGAQAPDFDDSTWKDFSLGGLWGGYDKIAWFRSRVSVPAEWRDEKVILRFIVGPRDGYGSTAETQLYVNGFPLQAIDVWHEEAWLPPEYMELDEITIALRAWNGIYLIPPQRRFKEAALIKIDQPTERFYYLTDTLLKALQQLDEHDLRRTKLLEVLNRAFVTVDFFEPRSPSYYSSVAEALEGLTEGLKELQVSEIKPSVNAIGHSHIDMAWMWQSHHTREKARRTFSTILHLMRQYPEFRYIHSSPQLYQFVKQDDPELYARIKEKIASGEWEATGGWWVESDTNIAGGESLVRQVLFGKRFLRREFGVDSKVLWMPDTFGFSWVIPQLMKKSGMEYFACSSIHWSKFNRFPHDTFHWRGMDGSEVLVTFFTAPGETIKNHYNYNGLANPYDVKTAWEHYRQKDVNTELLMPFGWGDGGGGPTREMLEAIRVQADIPGIPRVQIGTVEPYFQRLEERLKGKQVPVWDGELYLEAIRGVYTSQAYNKRANRQAERLYHDAEWLCSLADTLTGERGYPQSELNAGWEIILHNQFHDVLPGTSIPQVVEDCRADYARVEQIGQGVLAGAQEALARRIHTDEESVVVFNPLAWPRGGLIEIPWSESLAGKGVSVDGGKVLSSQTAGSDEGKKLLLEVDSIPSLGYRVFPVVSNSQLDANEITVTPTSLENRFYYITLNANGHMTSLFDKLNQREVLTAPGNVLQIFEDRSINGEAWEIDIFYQDKMRQIDNLLEAVVEETGPVRGVLRLTWRFANTTISQRLTIYRASSRMDFRTEVDWHEHQVLLKAAFPVNVRATRATYDIQFGSIERPTHWNTSFDMAHYENPAHKWVDLSEGNYGVALLNDCKYGYDVKDNVLRITLHRSPTEPDETADQGWHEFTYSLLPHAGTWRTSDVIQEAYALNDPLIARLAAANPQGDLPASHTWAEVDTDHVVLETVKKAEDEDAWIVRLYECKQYRSNAVTVTFGEPVRKAVECNLLEEEETQVDHQDHKLTFPINPFEIKTFKVWF
ncbi:MAG TPA: alpha-mannosidase [Anaerolineales bacterium]|jgi:alpha-mannosidase|nr:alpha-mannosidase [Anaerolineales bacterium]